MNPGTVSSLRSRTASGPRLWWLVGVWALIVLGGLAVLTEISARPVASRSAPLSWPVSSQIPREPGAQVLVVFVHPRCPCTAATLSELERALAWNRTGTRLVFAVVHPDGAPADWSESSLMRRVNAIGSGSVFRDIGAAEAHRFGAVASGHTVLYGAGGRLLFSGGITAGRGHEGLNDGRRAVEVLLSGGVPRHDGHPSYGCPLTSGTQTCVVDTCREPTP